ncbi:hypothetical protein EVAR_92508_1 [Eumeta japonica]|uniref:Uncharacterized protein n=1 Tax=Eumeta variegata TaxID=151549 RepID=A0A4C1T8U7_EUMVA|nr:hypothetical protein EVAR_92508_1 [Eumeta japonica]
MTFSPNGYTTIDFLSCLQIENAGTRFNVDRLFLCGGTDFTLPYPTLEKYNLKGVGRKKKRSTNSSETLGSFQDVTRAHGRPVRAISTERFRNTANVTTTYDIYLVEPTKDFFRKFKSPRSCKNFPYAMNDYRLPVSEGRLGNPRSGVHGQAHKPPLTARAPGHAVVIRPRLRASRSAALSHTPRGRPAPRLGGLSTCVHTLLLTRLLCKSRNSPIEMYLVRRL